MKYVARRLFIRRATAICFMLYGLILTLSSGCQFTPKENPFRLPWKKDEPKPLPDRILAVWTDSVLHQPQQPGIRGFGGRIYFYAKDETDPMKVDGSFAVYVFDADDVDIHSQKPLRKFMFTVDQFDEHMSKTPIGPSYSVWLPWGEIGGPPRRLSLIARFEGRDGGTTMSDPTIKLLPGVPDKEHSDSEIAGAKASSTSPIRLSGHQKSRDSVSDQEEADNEKETLNGDIKTIELPPSFQRHLRGDAIEATKAGATKADPTIGSPIDTSVLTQTRRQLDQSNEEAKSDNVAAAQPTTQVYDYRTRSRRSEPAFGSPKNDIRQGRWINSITRAP